MSKSKCDGLIPLRLQLALIPGAAAESVPFIGATVHTAAAHDKERADNNTDNNPFFFRFRS